MNSVAKRQHIGNDNRWPCHFWKPYPGNCLKRHRNLTKHINVEAGNTVYFLREDLSNKRQEWPPLTKDQVVVPYRGTDLKFHAFDTSALYKCEGKSHASASFNRHSPAGTENWPEKQWNRENFNAVTSRHSDLVANTVVAYHGSEEKASVPKIDYSSK